MNVPWRAVAGGVELAVRVTPAGRVNRVDGVELRDDGTAVLRLRVTAPADRGRANAAVLEVLARHLGVPRSTLEIVSGDTARLKRIRIAGDPDVLAARLARPIG